ncbi:MAG TPA: hypothetical protein VFJ82_04350, partial [Longimicrobium sp.]|nr:hypothetical protein [Longimicrobium sp.]
PFAAVLADRVSSTLRVDGTGVSFTVDRLLNTLLLPLPDLSLPDGTTAPLGSLALAATDFSVRLGEGVAVGARLGVGLPPEINHLFGVERGADGRPAPRTRLLETYDDASRPATPLGVEVRAGLRQGTLGVEVLPGALPFRGFREENDEFVLEMGELGSVRFRRPVLRYDPAAGTLHAEGGFTQRGLKLPLGWLRPVLGSLGMEALAERLPAAVPLAEVSLLRDGEVDAELAIEVFEGLLSAPLDPALRQAVRAVAGHFNRLPPRLRDYLDVRLPGELAFRLSVTPDGGFQLHLSTGTETERPGPGATRSLTPLKLLVPTVGPLGVELVGIRLYGVTVGMALGGQLLVLQVDAEADRFDLVSLAAAMALDAAGSAVLRPPAQLGQTLVVRDLLAVVVIATQVPVPIPLFYDEVAVLAGEPTGFELAVRVRFPRPRLSLRELLGSAQRIRRFATEEEYFFGGDPGARGPREMDLRWTIGESYLQLPPWLGGEVLGVRGRDLAEVSALETIERALDAVKGFEVVPLIESIPLQHRVGETALALGPLRAQARWLLASLAEYPAAVAGEPAWASRGATIQRVLELARAAPGAGGAAADERGLVALLGGACAVGGATLEATAALVAGRRRGVATGFRVAGELERLFALELAGVVVAAPREGRWEMEGTSSLALFGERVFAGSVRGDAGSLRIDGVLDLFAWAPGSPLQARGELRGHLDRDGFLLEGAAWVSLGGGDALTLAGARFHLSPGRAELAGTLLGQTVSLALSAEGRRVRLEGGLEHALEVPGLLRVGAWEGAGGPRVRVAGPEAPELLLDGSLTVLGVTSSTRVHLSADGFRCDFAGDLLGLFACRGSLRGGGLLSGQGVEASLVLENGLAALEEMVLARVREGLSSLRARAGEAGATLAAERDRYNEALGREIRRLEQEAAERRGGALQAVDAASQQVREARWAVDDLDRRIAEARAAVAADRERVEASFRDAQAHLEEKRRGLDVIREQIAAHDAWYHGLHWALQALSWGPYLAGKAALELAWAGADAALSLARDVVTTASLAKDAVHPDADPRVTTLLAARLTVDAALQTASAVLQVAEQGLHALPDWVLQPTLLAAEASRVVGDAALALAQGTVEAADQALRGAEQAVAWMGEHAMPVRVERLAFTTALEPGRLPRVQAAARLSWALPGGGRDVRDAELDIDFADLPGTAARLATQLLPAA